MTVAPSPLKSQAKYTEVRFRDGCFCGESAMTGAEVAGVDAPRVGQVAYIVDELGGTFAFPREDEAVWFLADEARGGAEDLTMFTVTVPRDGMTWFEVAEYACQTGPTR